jgi:large subunit ribosomal protein L6
MKKKFSEELEIPSGISCDFSNSMLTCKKDSQELKKKIDIPFVKTKIENNKVIFSCDSGNQKQYKTMKSFIAHLKNMFTGLQEGYIYRLESANVHFPMTFKVEGDKLTITNFLGEKTPRFARILPGVKVDIKGSKITVASSDKEAAGQTAANFEKATKIKNRDRRVFQDGIYLVERPRGAK